MKKVLIVDDEYGIRSLVRATLDGGEFEIIEAREGGEAIYLAQLHQPDLVLLDVMLPDLSGIEVCRRLKAVPGLASTTIVMLTAQAQASDVGEAEEAGADGYFTKPFSPIALSRKVEEVLGLKT